MEKPSRGNLFDDDDSEEEFKPTAEVPVAKVEEPVAVEEVPLVAPVEEEQPAAVVAEEPTG